jgi:hypothetical protein
MCAQRPELATEQGKRGEQDSRRRGKRLAWVAAAMLLLNGIAWVRWGWFSCDPDAAVLVPGSARSAACGHFRGAGRIDWILFLPFVGVIAAIALRVTRARSLAAPLAVAAIAGLLFVFLMPTIFQN